MPTARSFYRFKSQEREEFTLFEIFIILSFITQSSFICFQKTTDLTVIQLYKNHINNSHDFI
ncbi:hypothetical protein GW891_02620 [bacterium]|nr:hypothetical protein [bacterium]